MSAMVFALSLYSVRAWVFFFASSFRGRPPLLSAGPGRVEPGPGPLADDVPLELGQGREDVEDQLPAAGRRVDALLEAAEADLPLLELPDGLDQVPEAPAQAVELPDHEGVPLPEV